MKMQKNISTGSFFSRLAVMILLLGYTLQAQIPSYTMRITDVEKGSNTLKFSVYMKNTSASGITYSGSQLVMDFNKNLLKDQNDTYGTPTFTLLSSDLALALQPRNLTVLTNGTTGILRTSAPLPPRTPGGANNAPVIAAGDSILIGRFQLASSNAFFKAGEFADLAFRVTPSANPITKVGAYLSNVNTEIQSGSTFLVQSFSSSLAFTVFIEGLYDGSTMIPDTITVSLRKATAPYEVVDQCRAVVSDAGLANLQFKQGIEGASYYLVVNHRNAVETWSAESGISLAASQSYNMSTDAAQAYGSNLKLINDKYCIYSGEVTDDYYLELGDVVAVYNAYLNDPAGDPRYVTEDLNGDGYVDLSDVVMGYNNYLPSIYSINPLSGKKANNVHLIQTNSKE